MDKDFISFVLRCLEPLIAKPHPFVVVTDGRQDRPYNNDADIPVLKKSRWLFLKRRENRTDKQDTSLATLLQYNLKTIRSYLLKEDFQSFWDYCSPYWAGVFLDRWCTRVMRSRIEPMKKVARMLRRHRELIVNWFRAKKEFSSGIVEGLNAKAKVATRKAYGFKRFKTLELALFHNLGALPEPEVTHKFF
jgi:transposase